jgi:hypothetical protein
MASENPNMSNQGTAGKMKHITLMVPQELEIIRSPECREGQREVMASYYIGSLNIYDIK